MESPLQFGCKDHWIWNKHRKSHQVILCNSQTALFHPMFSTSTAAICGSRVLNFGMYYWEIRMERVYGTSMMFGIGTRKARLHSSSFVNLLGEDEESWGLSHEGLLWHNGKSLQYTKPFNNNEKNIVGILYDSRLGTVTYYKDSVCLGVAFSGFCNIKDELYPIVSSTAAQTLMTLGCMRRAFINLQDRCRSTILKHIHDDIGHLNLPTQMKAYLTEEEESKDQRRKLNQ